MHVIDSWRGFRALDANRRRLVVEAGVLLAVVWVGLHAVPFPRVRRALDACAKRMAGGSPSSPDLIGWAVSAAARRFPLGRTCLVEALTADLMLRRRRNHSVVRFGVRRFSRGARPIDGHAWVECDGAVVVGWLENLVDYTDQPSPDVAGSRTNAETL